MPATTHPHTQPLADGHTIAVDAGPVTIAVQCIRPGHAYRLSIRHRSSSAEIGELSRSYPTEHQARHAARVATTLFRAGWNVQDVLNLIDAFTT